MFDYSVMPIKKQDTYDWILNIHYAKRLPTICFAFGLFKDKKIKGISTFGKPASNSLCIGILGKEYSSKVYELNRLVVEEGLEKNVLSYFVSQSLKLLKRLKKPLCLVSYADSGLGHHGYIYQATNWIYTGCTKERTDIQVPEGKHSRHYDKNIDYSLNRKIRTAKFRYVYFIGMKPQIKEMKKELKYPIIPYPKGDNKRYEINKKAIIQEVLW
ncbi:MAG: hypothetical protein WC623_24285 [Pedobacter sp.]|uniref:Mom family adenine methylcarbamoylation protein n=1 Tax=Pedobacter sp. TaxID=1411316 RepID=UPI00356181EB